MALGDGTTWDETLPTDSTVVSAGDDHIRDVRIGIRGRLAREHEFPSSQSATNEAGVHKFITLQSQTAAPTVSGTQVAAIYQSSATDAVMITCTSGTGTNTVQITDGTRVRAETGQIIQIVSTNITAITSTFAAIPFDNTTPQITEGAGIGSLAVTPTASGSSLIITAQFNFMQASVSGNRQMAMALFLGTTAGAIAAQPVANIGVLGGVASPFKFVTTSPSTTACTYSFRAGAADSAQSWTVNAVGNATNNFNDLLVSNITIMEVQP